MIILCKNPLPDFIHLPLCILLIGSCQTNHEQLLYCCVLLASCQNLLNHGQIALKQV